MWVVVPVSCAQADYYIRRSDILLAVEWAVVSGVPKTAEEAMENLKSYVVFRAPKGYDKEHVTIQDPCERNEGTEGPC